ncbi:hypothetical protein [Peribacillus frigoritolerans]|uniref:hypothetical protein n=1 Tax=Peribacillus frigoritolerans TaxID=450367 RepID=UPI002E1AE91C|nr:hypothetical protein [Peribacillus frigoritolerans]MED3845539.1 hypothetical protein [Peribacillus frigoritolerans]
MNNYFFCYSTTLFHFLKANQQRYIVAGLHEKTLNKFWLFEKTPELSRFLDEYDARKSEALGNR